jgi:hypothetical protein
MFVHDRGNGPGQLRGNSGATVPGNGPVKDE